MSECIYKFVEQPQQKKPKKQIYRSKYDPNSALIGSTFCMHGTTAIDGKGFHSLKKVRFFRSVFTCSECDVTTIEYLICLTTL